MAHRDHDRPRRAARAGAAEALLRRRPGRAGRGPDPGEPRTPRRVRGDPRLDAGRRAGGAAPGAGDGDPVRARGDCVLGGARGLGFELMATAAEPRRSELPLKGGREGANVTLTPILTATVGGPIQWFLRDDGRMAKLKGFGIGVPKDQWVKAPIQCFLVEHPVAGAILIDTGFHASVAVKPRSNLGMFGTVIYRDIDMRPEQSAAAQLRERGIEPAKVRTVVMTHLHPDHASAIADFPEATFLVSKAEWEGAAGSGQKDGYVKRQFDHGFDYRLVDFDSEAANSFSGFGRSFDVFGDGSMRMVYTPGHTLGHMSVVLQTGSGEVLVAGDSIFMHRTLEDDHMPWAVPDEHLFRRSLREIRQYVKETPDALVIPGHDWEAWQTLEASY